MSEMKRVYQAANLPQAHLLKQELERAGIPASVTHDVSEVSSTWNAGPIVLVNAENVEAAKPLVAVFERHIVEDSARVNQASEESPIEYWKEWPRCPECEALRQAICPICKAAGTHFPLADFIPAAQVHSIGVGTNEEEPTYDDSSVLLMCDACEEAFAPRFYRRCHSCGHAFEEGIKIASEPVAEFSSRALIVIFGTVAVVGGLLAFFAWVLR